MPSGSSSGWRSFPCDVSYTCVRMSCLEQTWQLLKTKISVVTNAVWGAELRWWLLISTAALLSVITLANRIPLSSQVCGTLSSRSYVREHHIQGDGFRFWLVTHVQCAPLNGSFRAMDVWVWIEATGKVWYWPSANGALSIDTNNISSNVVGWWKVFFWGKEMSNDLYPWFYWLVHCRL